jgi:hypothetical protein
MDMGQTHDAEVGRKNHFYCYMFCEEVQGICGSREPQTRLGLHSQIAPSDSNVGSTPHWGVHAKKRKKALGDVLIL